MKTFISSGHHIDIAAPSGGVSSGDGVLLGNLFGVTSSTAAEGAAVTITTTGVFSLPKLTTAVITAGARVSWDATEGYVNVPGVGLYPVGTAIEAAGNGTTAIKVRLDGVSTVAAAA